MLTLRADDLSTYRHPLRWTQTKATRPVRFRLDSDGCSLAVDLPGPAYLADFVAIAPAAQRRGSAIIVDGEPVDLLPLAAALRAQLAALPAHAGEGASHRDLRLAAATDSERVAAYCLDVVRALRATLPLEQRPARPRGPRKTDAENCRNYRARVRAVEIASAAKWFTFWLDVDCWDDEDDDQPPHEGMRILGHELYEFGADAVEGEPFDEDDETDDGPVFVTPRPINFYRALDAVMGPRRRSKHGHIWVVPPLEAAIARAEQVLATCLEEYMNGPLFTREELLAEMARQERQAIASIGAERPLAPVVPLRVAAR